MYRGHPVSNKICSKRMEEHAKDLHMQRLKEIKSTESRTYKLQVGREKLLDECNRMRNNNHKKIAIKALVNGEIQRENNSLYQKMSQIMRHSHASTALNC